MRVLHPEVEEEVQDPALQGIPDPEQQVVQQLQEVVPEVMVEQVMLLEQ